MKFVVVLCLALFAFGANAGSIHNKIHKTLKDIDEGITAAIDKAQEIVDATKVKADEFNDEVVKAVNEENEKNTARLEEFYKKYGNKLDEIFAKPKDPKTAICREIAEDLRNSVLENSANTFNCLIEKTSPTVDYIEEITNVSTAVIDDFHKTRTEAHNCVNNIDGFKNESVTIACLTKAATKASLISVKNIPEIILTFGKLELYVHTLAVTLPECADSTGFNGALEKANKVLEQTDKCYKEASA